MKRSINSLIGYAIGATDGEIGKVKEFYFDDFTWIVRCVIVETANWLNGRKVLLSPQALLTPDWKNEVFTINLTKEKIKKSPILILNNQFPASMKLKCMNTIHVPVIGEVALGWRNGHFGSNDPESSPNCGAVTRESSTDTKDNDEDSHLRSTNLKQATR